MRMRCRCTASDRDRKATPKLAELVAGAFDVVLVSRSLYTLKTDCSTLADFNAIARMYHPLHTPRTTPPTHPPRTLHQPNRERD